MSECKCIEKISYEPTQKALQFYSSGLDHTKRLITGDSRTGKTIAIIAEIAYHLTGNYPEWWNGYRYDSKTRVIIQSNSYDSSENIRRYLTEGMEILPFINNELMRVEERDDVKRLLVKHKSGGVSEVRGSMPMDPWHTTHYDIVFLENPEGFVSLNNSLILTTANRHAVPGETYKAFILVEDNKFIDNSNIVSFFLRKTTYDIEEPCDYSVTEFRALERGFKI